MTGQSDLDRLCVHYGVAAEYTDIWGECHRVPEHTRRTLLAAMGVEAIDPVSEQRALIEARERTWQRMLPPVKVLWEGQDRLEFDLALPASRAEQMMRWVLQEETGARQELGQTEQVNLPGSGESYPNWRQRLPLELEAWTEQPETVCAMSRAAATLSSATVSGADA